MRAAIFEKIHAFMKENEDVYLLTGDLGYGVLEKIEKDVGKRFIDIGIAEQNMIGIASGLALSGKKVFVYSIIPFVTMRCFEQIRNDICYHNLDVVVLGVGSGLSYGILGSTHFALEDIGILRGLPNMTVLSPADETDAILAINAVFKHKGPVYFRIGKKEEPTVIGKPYNFKIGKGHILKQGKDVTIFSSGTIFENVLIAEKILREKHNISATIVNIHTIKPIDKELVIKTAKGKKAVFTVEEHSVIGGLGSAVGEVLVQTSNMPVLKIMGTNDHFIKDIGTQEYLRNKLGLSSEAIVAKVISTLKG